jgi:hypothetical protein
MSQKYPRTFHLPYSPGATNDDKIAKDLSSLIGVEIVISEKLDGSNSCMEPTGVFARSHGQTPTHKSFDLLKQRFYALQYSLHPNEQIFLENCYAVHSITYEELSDFCFVLGVRKGNDWLSVTQTQTRAGELGLTPVPVLFKGIVKNEKELEKIVLTLATTESIFGGAREGIVVRTEAGFADQDFSKCVMKWVRKDHVQTSEHWMNQPIIKQNFLYK